MNSERNLEKLSKAELINLVEKLQNKARKSKIAIVEDNNGKVPQPQKPRRSIPPRNPKSGCFVKIHPDRPKPPKQPALPRLRDAKGRFISRRQFEPVVQQAPIQIRKNQNAQKPPKPKRPPPAPPIKEHITDVPVPMIKELYRALKKHAKSYGIELQDNLNPLNPFTKTKVLVESHLEDLLKTMKGFKFIETLEVTFKKETIDSKTGERVSIYKTTFFNGKAKTITKVNDIEPELNTSRQEILNTIDGWISEGSGWVIDRIDSHYYINVITYRPLQGSSYIELPTKLRSPKKGLINIKNKDNECFRWCHIRHLNPQKKNPQRITKVDKQFIGGLNYKGIKFPVSQKQYNKIEKQNSIRVNIFGYEKGQPFPIHIMYNQSKHKERKHFCMYCLQCFSSEGILVKHTNNCLTINGKQAINMPKKDENVLKFNNFHKQLPVPFVIYTNFEAITKKVQSCRPNDNKSYTEAYQNHEDCGYGYKVVCCY